VGFFLDTVDFDADAARIVAAGGGSSRPRAMNPMAAWRNGAIPGATAGT
jgi:hypothetical protein